MTERWSLDDLRVFCAVADAGSLTAAGDAVGLSLSSVSARLKKRVKVSCCRALAQQLHDAAPEALFCLEQAGSRSSRRVVRRQAQMNLVQWRIA